LALELRNAGLRKICYSFYFSLILDVLLMSVKLAIFLRDLTCI